MEGKSFRPTNLNDIPKFKSDTSKWVYFFANLTEEVWVPLKEVFEADYRRHLRFQIINDDLAVAAGAEETKVHILYTFIHTFLSFHLLLLRREIIETFSFSLYSFSPHFLLFIPFSLSNFPLRLADGIKCYAYIYLYYYILVVI